MVGANVAPTKARSERKHVRLSPRLDRVRLAPAPSASTYVGGPLGGNTDLRRAFLIAHSFRAVAYAKPHCRTVSNYHRGSCRI
jgi:hypothetical protein